MSELDFSPPIPYGFASTPTSNLATDYKGIFAIGLKRSLIKM